MDSFNEDYFPGDKATLENAVDALAQYKALRKRDQFPGWAVMLALAVGAGIGDSNHRYSPIIPHSIEMRVGSGEDNRCNDSVTLTRGRTVRILPLKERTSDGTCVYGEQEDSQSQ